MVGLPVAHRELGLQPVGERQPPTLTAAVIGQDAARRAVQPESGLISRWDIVQPPPGGQECFSQDVGCIIRVVRSAQGISEHRDAMCCVRFLEPVPSLGLCDVGRR